MVGVRHPSNDNMSICSVGDRQGDVIVGRVVRHSVSTMAADGVRDKLAEEGVGNDGGVVLLPLRPYQIVVSGI